MINKIKSTKRIGSFTRNQWLLSFMLFSTLIQNVFCKTITESDQKKNKTIVSLPKITVLQTFKDWSSRLGSNQTTPQTTALVFEESKEVRTTDYGLNHKPLINSTEKSISDSKDSLMTSTETVPKIISNISPEIENKTDSNKIQSINSDQVNAHNIAAQVLSKILHIKPLLALASNGVPHRRLNYSRAEGYETDQNKNKIIKRMPSIETLNEIDVDSDVKHFKSERMSASGISFPTTPPTTTDLIINTEVIETTPTDPPPEYIEHPPTADDEHEHHEGTEQEEDEQTPHEDQEDYEDDEELESFNYPVKVNYHDNDDYNGQDKDRDREAHMPFVIPNINLNPESLKQKGCRTVVKEVQTIPILKDLQNQNIQNPNNIMKRMKRNSDNSQKFTSIVMTKECHFPGDEGASTEEIPLTISSSQPSTASQPSNLDSKLGVAIKTPTPPYYDDYDVDFDFRSQYPYPSKSGLIDRMQPKSSNGRRSYADNPIFRSDNGDYGFDEPNDPNFYDFNEEMDNQKKRKPKPKKPKKRTQMSSSDSFDDEEFGPQPKPRKNSRSKKPPLYRNDRGEGGGHQRGGKKKPKKINRSFAFFRRAEPKDKVPNENDYAVSYGRGNFQSFSDSYDSDRDGPRKGKSGKIKYHHRSDDDDDDED